MPRKYKYHFELVTGFWTVLLDVYKTLLNNVPCFQNTMMGIAIKITISKTHRKLYRLSGIII